jgi:hypothetical protein
MPTYTEQPYPNTTNTDVYASFTTSSTPAYFNTSVLITQSSAPVTMPTIIAPSETTSKPATVTIAGAAGNLVSQGGLAAILGAVAAAVVI